MSVNISRRILQVYKPPTSKSSWCFKSAVGNCSSYYYAYARQALYAALKFSGVGPGDKILFPELICADLIPAVSLLGATVIYYPVNKSLAPDCELVGLEKAKIIVAVNYFGFPQELDDFKGYCKKNKAILIEDNAHGLFSCDKNDILLGTRGDFGLFSLRKTLPLLNGAALVVCNENVVEYSSDLPSKDLPQVISPVWRLKGMSRKIVAFSGVKFLRNVISLGRAMRGFILNRSSASRITKEKMNITPAEPYIGFIEDSGMVDIDEEIKRRRELYQWLEEYLNGEKCVPVFKDLTNNTVPYGYPFYSNNTEIISIRNKLKRIGLDCNPWPELPDGIRSNCPEWYKNIWSVQFLW